MRERTRDVGALLVALAVVACCCHLIRAETTTIQNTSETVANFQQTNTSPSVISGLLREQLTRQQPTQQQQAQSATTSTQTSGQVVHDRVAPTTSNAFSGQETKVPSQPQQTNTSGDTTTTTSQKPASQPLAQQTETTPQNHNQNQFQFVRPQSKAQAEPLPEATTLTATTTPTPVFNSSKQETPQCVHNNRTYSIGQRWDDDCIQSCECVLGSSGEDLLTPVAISACRPLCPTYGDPPGDKCKLQRNKPDNCCLEWRCELDGKFAPGFLASEVVLSSTPTTLRELYKTSAATTTTTAAPTTTTVAPTRGITTTTTTTTTTTQRPTATVSVSQTVRDDKRRIPVSVTIAAITTRQPNTILPVREGRLHKPEVPQDSPPNQRLINRPRPGRVGDTTSQTFPTQFNSDLPLNTEPDLEGTQPPPPAAADDEPAAIDPTQLDLCIIPTDDKAWRVNSRWVSGSCKIPCRCVFAREKYDPQTDINIYPTKNLRLNSFSTEIRCGLPAECVQELKRLVPTAECPEPRPIPSEDTCACPQISCGDAASLRNVTRETTTKPTLTSTTSDVVGCKSAGHTLAVGETFNDECHSICRCGSDGEIRCEQLTCQPPHDHLCLEWAAVTTNTTTIKPARCCPEYVCKTPVPVFESATTTTTTSRPQHKSCSLLGSQVPHGKLVPEQIQPRDDPNDSCPRICTCLDGKIVCQPACPDLDGEPPIDLDCPPSMAYQTSLPGECCPRWACPLAENYTLPTPQVRTLNATAIEVLLVLPEFAANRKGKLEFNYTSASNGADYDASDLPPPNAIWTRRPSIRTPDGVLSSRQIKFFRSDLKPGHRYWFKVLVRFEDPEGPPFDAPLESALQTIVMPPLEDLSEATTTSKQLPSITTTTITPSRPPTRILQPVRGNPPTIILTPTVTSTAATTTTTTTTTTTQAPSTTASPTTSTTTTPKPTSSVTSQTFGPDGEPNIVKPSVSQIQEEPKVPCKRPTKEELDDGNHLDQQQPKSSIDSVLVPNPWSLTEQIHNAPVQRYAWHLLVAFSVMTVLFTIVSYLYFKKSRVIAPITSPYHHQLHGHHHQSAYENPTFTKLISYYANQPHVQLLVDENNQNFDNLAKQKNMEVDKSSPLHHNNNNNGTHHHVTTPVHHQNGRQHLI